MAKLRQFSHFLQQINKWVLYPFSKIQRELRVYFRSFVIQISINRKLRPNMTGKVTEYMPLTENTTWYRYQVVNSVLAQLLDFCRANEARSTRLNNSLMCKYCVCMYVVCYSINRYQVPGSNG